MDSATRRFFYSRGSTKQPTDQPNAGGNMPKIELRTSDRINIDGHEYDANEVVCIGLGADPATIDPRNIKHAANGRPVFVVGETVVAEWESDHNAGDLVSAVKFGRCIIATADPAAVRQTVANRTAKITDEPPTLPPDPFANEDAAAVAAAEESAAAAGPDAPPTPAELAPLEGLPERIAVALVRQSLGTREAIAAYVARGNNLEDLEDVGRAAVRKIHAWLGAKPTPAPAADTDSDDSDTDGDE